MIDAGVPGIRKSVALISPPLTEPTYIDTSRIIASIPSMENVQGRDKEISIAPVSPGIAPTMIPSAVPSSSKPNGSGAKRPIEPLDGASPIKGV